MPSRDVTDLFDRLAPRYDRTNRILSLGSDLRWRKKLAEHLPQKQSLALLDVASGTGDQIAALLDANSPIETAIGIDLSLEMLKKARVKFEQRSDRCSVRFIAANAEALPFADQTFDACTCAFGIRNVQNPKAMLKEMRRVVKPQGRCLILEFSLPKGWLKIPYLFYLRHLLPSIGGLIGRDFKAFRYLNRTIESFSKKERCLDWMREAGWTNVVEIPSLCGAIALYRGECP